MKSSTHCTVAKAPEHIALSRTDSIGDVMEEAMQTLQAMAQDGFQSHACAVPLLKEATAIALQVTNGMPVVEIARACAWARAVGAKAERDVRALADTRQE